MAAKGRGHGKTIFRFEAFTETGTDTDADIDTETRRRRHGKHTMNYAFICSILAGGVMCGWVSRLLLHLSLWIMDLIGSMQSCPESGSVCKTYVCVRILKTKRTSFHFNDMEPPCSRPKDDTTTYPLLSFFSSSSLILPRDGATKEHIPSSKKVFIFTDLKYLEKLQLNFNRSHKASIK